MRNLIPRTLSQRIVAVILFRAPGAILVVPVHEAPGDGGVGEGVLRADDGAGDAGGVTFADGEGGVETEAFFEDLGEVAVFRGRSFR